MKKLKPWIRWTIWIFGSFLVVVLLAIGFMYYKINAIQMEDILKRHAPSVAGEQIEGLKDNSQTNSTALPSFVSSPVDKANEFASKPIQSQDALDVAAILLKSGLSLKEVYYLTGQASDKLSNSEKQKIRDLLLSKLTKEEIESLRAITTPYGKELKILDPDYPIELIGVYDPEERKKILSELQDKEKSLKSQQIQEQNNKQEIVVKDEEKQLTSQVEPSSAPSDPALIETYNSKLDSLKNSCQSNISNLVSSVVNAKKGNKDLGLKELQSAFMQKFVDAESKCDSGFNGILSDAGKAGVGSGEIDGWKQSYNAMKQAAQNSAVGQIEKALSNK
ncbi:hypothetical protein [Paenibacillus planticolens]|uniref:Uncharacterized protein n=1 Tax=Paenibacillus planticolens TaxID=2654976 RepID=A0ABX1ZN25_9BACL|nr:hypothetical protein [Paenibacillus planticolens]NOV00015.1 hypothetical protein [Paenibacillus planticolens]